MQPAAARGCDSISQQASLCTRQHVHAKAKAAASLLATMQQSQQACWPLHASCPLHHLVLERGLAMLRIPFAAGSWLLLCPLLPPLPLPAALSASGQQWFCAAENTLYECSLMTIGPACLP